MSMDNVTASSDAVLSPNAHFDDQGLFFTLILGAVLFGSLSAALAFVHLTPVLWLRRLYRPNHTSLPLSTAACTNADVDADSLLQRCERGDDPLTRSAPLTSSDAEDAHTSAANTADAPLPYSSTHTTAPSNTPPRKHIGILLPYKATLLHLPRWRDWWQVEETSVKHLESMFASMSSDVGAAAPPGASFVPTADVYSAVGVHAVHVTDTSFQASVMPRSRTLQPPHAFSSRRVAKTDAAVPHANEATDGLHSEQEAPLSSLPTTLLDPQIALYTFTLRYFITLMFGGVCLTIWIAVIANSDDYLKLFMVRRDMRHCHRHDNDSAACHILAPYCTYIDGSVGCLPVGLPGLYDMTVQNIQPASWRWWLVAWLSAGFCVVFVLTTLWFVHTVDAYVKRVMAVQVRYALGYRVACVRGVDAHSIDSSEVFMRRFLDVRAYFPRRHAWSDVRLSHIVSNTIAQSSNNNNSGGGGGGGNATDDDDDDAYELVDWSGKSCLFSTMFCHYVVTRRSDAVFTQPGKVRELLFTRAAPPGMSRAMKDAESAMSALQEAIAEEKVLRRRVARASRDRAATSTTTEHGQATVYYDVDAPVRTRDGDSDVEDEHAAGDVRLMMRAPFPSCCHRVPAVPLRTRRFRAAATRLNERVVTVADQHADGPVFVVFTDSRSAFEFVNLFHARYGGMLTMCKAIIAGPPGNIIFDNARTHRIVLLARFFLFSAAFVIMLFFWSVPIGLLSSLDNIALIPGVGHTWGKYYSSHVPQWLRNIVSAYLPVIVLAVFNLVLPMIVRLTVVYMGAVTKTERDGGQFYLLYLFSVLTGVIFQAALQGGLTQLANVVRDPDGEAIRNFFVACVSPVGGYWYAKVVMAATLSTMIDALDPLRVLPAVLMQSVVSVQRNYDALFVSCDPDLPSCYSSDLVFLAMGLLFHMTAPMLQLFVVFYFVVRYYTQRSRLYDGYAPSLPPARDCTDFGIATQVVRIVAWLYCVAEVGAVLLMSVRQHTGGVVVCSLTLVVACAMLVYVHLRSRHWIVTLSSVRRIHDELERASSAPNASPRSNDDDSVIGSAQHMSPVAEQTDTTVASEFPRAFTFDEMRNNPYIGHILPRKPGTHSRYQPKHQRLAVIDVDDELRRMHAFDFVVHRYWSPQLALPTMRTTQAAVRRVLQAPLVVVRPLQSRADVPDVAVDGVRYVREPSDVTHVQSVVEFADVASKNL